MTFDKKQISLGLLSGVVIGAATLGTIGVSAQSTGGGETFLDRVSTTFGIDKAELEAERDAFREEKKAEHQEARAEHVAGLVEAGTLTQEQADELAELKDGFKAEIEALKESEDASREDFQALKEARKADVEAWAEANSIDLDDIRPEKGELGGRHGHHGARGGFGPGV